MKKIRFKNTEYIFRSGKIFITFLMPFPVLFVGAITKSDFYIELCFICWGVGLYVKRLKPREKTFIPYVPFSYIPFKPTDKKEIDSIF